MKSNLRQAIATVLIVSVFSMGLPLPAQAGIVGTTATADRERIAAVLEREDVRARLAAQGVGPAEAKARVAALTDEEASRLAAEMDALPAGGDIGSLLMVLVVAVYAVVLVVALILGAAVQVVKSIDASSSDSGGGAASTGDAAPAPAPVQQ